LRALPGARPSRFSQPTILLESHVVPRNFPPSLHLNGRPDSETLNGGVKKR